MRDKITKFWNKNKRKMKWGNVQQRFHLNYKTNDFNKFGCYQFLAENCKFALNGKLREKKAKIFKTVH